MTCVSGRRAKAANWVNAFHAKLDGSRERLAKPHSDAGLKHHIGYECIKITACKQKTGKPHCFSSLDIGCAISNDKATGLPRLKRQESFGRRPCFRWTQPATATPQRSWILPKMQKASIPWSAPVYDLVSSD
jgi:hypothetical protein